MATPRFRLAILGGGIAGLTLAVALGRYEQADSPIQIDMYEAGAEITTVGAGISVWERTWSIMRDLGLYDELASKAVKASASDDDTEPAFLLRKSDWPQGGYEFGRVMVPKGATSLLRADMVAVLARHLPSSCTIHTSKRLATYTEMAPADASGDAHASPSYYVLHFADGTSAEADAVVGADGIRSKTRATMYERAHAQACVTVGAQREESWEACARCGRAAPTWTGTVAYRSMIPAERVRAVAPNHSALQVRAPMSVSGWLLLTWAIHVIEDLPFSVHGRVALIGDSVHAMTTHFGAGGGQAIEDAYILGRLLADRRTTLPRVDDVFRIYQAVRLAFARNVVCNSGKVGLMYELNSAGLYDGSSSPSASEEEDMEVTRERLGDLARAIQEKWEWQWKERVEEQWEEAERRYEELLADGQRKAE